MSQTNDPDSLPTERYATPAGPERATPARLSDSALEGLFGANSPVTRGGWQPPTPEELQGRLSQYEILELIGRGGMGAVYKGWQKSLDRAVAIKILPPGLQSGEVDFVARFQREARAMAKLKHASIIPVHDAGETPDGLLYFVMDFVEGTDLQKMMAARGKLPAAEALPITSRVLDALAYAHQRGIIHRDIKPANIMVDTEGNVLVADFGLARSIGPDTTMLTGSHVAMGTPDFMAPESHLGMDRLDLRADLYAVGVMLYQMLTGKLPRGRFEAPSRVVPGLDKRLDRIVDRSLQQEREARYSSALELKSDLDPVLVRAVARGKAPRLPAAGSLRTKSLLFALIAVVVCAVSGWFLWSKPDNKLNVVSKSDSKKGATLASSTASFPAEALKPVGVAAPTTQAPYPSTGSNGEIIYPPGVWTRWWTPVDEAAIIERKDGDWLRLSRHSVSHKKDFTNVGLRARFRGQRLKEDNFPQFNLRSNAVASTSLNLYIISSGDKVALRQPQLGKGISALAEAWLKDKLRPTPREYTMEFYAIGSTVIGRVNGETVTTTLQGPATHGNINLYSANADFIRDLEILNLDGLPEAEALKLVGVPPAAPVGSEVWAVPTEILTYAGHRYQFIPGHFSWTEAKAKAEAMGGHLATLTSAAEAQWAKQHFLTHSALIMWLGARRTADSDWMWITGEPWDYTDWARWKDGRSEPSADRLAGGPSSDCLQFLWHTSSVPPGGWDDVRESGLFGSGVESGLLVEWEEAGNRRRE